MNPKDIIDSFIKESKQRYGEDFFIEVKEGERLTVFLMLKSLKEKLLNKLGNSANQVDVKTLEEDQGIDCEITQDYINLYTKRKADDQNLADQLITGEKIRVWKIGKEDEWIPVAVHHDFENQAPIQLGWIQYDPSKITEKDYSKDIGRSFSAEDFKKETDRYLPENSKTTYLLGGKTFANGFDCSSFTQVVFKRLTNLWLPRLSRWQALVGTEIQKDQLKIGDLIYFTNSEGRVFHIGFVYKLNQGKLPTLAHFAFSVKRMMIEDLNEVKWLNEDFKLAGFRRI